MGLGLGRTGGSFCAFWGCSVVGLGLGQGIGSMMGLVLVRQRAHGRCVGPPPFLSLLSLPTMGPQHPTFSLSLSLSVSITLS